MTSLEFIDFLRGVLSTVGDRPLSGVRCGEFEVNFRAPLVEEVMRDISRAAEEELELMNRITREISRPKASNNIEEQLEDAESLRLLADDKKALGIS